MKKVPIFLLALCSFFSFSLSAQQESSLDPLELKEFLDEQEGYYAQSGLNQRLGNDFQENELLVTESALETVTWDLELMKNAKHSIELSGSFCGGKIFRSMLTVMEQKLTEIPHFQVHVLTCPTLMDGEDERRAKELQKKFPDRFHLIFTNTLFVVLPDLASIDNHVKVVIVDEKYFTTGGTNKEDCLATEGTYPVPRNNKGTVIGSYLPAGARDMDVAGFGPLAKDLRLLFYKLFALWEYCSEKGSLPKNEKDSYKYNRYFPIVSEDLAVVESLDTNSRLIHNPPIKIIFSGPMDRPNKISKEYERLINNAKSKILIGNLYWNPVDYIFKAAMSAANRGIEIKLFTNGINDLTPSYNGMFIWASRINYVPIFYGREFHIWQSSKAKSMPLCKTQIFEYHVKDTLYHKKVMVIDDQITLIGSYNLGTKSDYHDYEIVLVIDSKEVAKDVLKVFEKDEQHSLQVSVEDARDWYFNPLTVYLAGTQKHFHGFMSVPHEQEDSLDFNSNDLANKMGEWNNFAISNNFD